MADLYTGLIKGRKKSFWGEYDSLNNYPIPTNDEIFNLQMANLLVLEQTKNYNITNTFIEQANKRVSGLNEDIENESESRIYARIMELLNAGLWGNVEMNPTRRQAEGLINAQQKNQEIDNIMEEVIMLLRQVKVNEPLSREIVDRLDYRLKHQSGTDNKFYTNLKAQLAEELAVDFLSKNEGYRAIQTGNFVDELGQQLIEDVMAFTSENQSLGGWLSFSVKNKTNGQSTNLHASSLDDFFSKIEKLNQDYTIQLSVPLYDALKEASALNAQVKSGMKSQPILTRAARNAISLGELTFEPDKFKELYLLPGAERWFKPEEQQHSNDLAQLANLALANDIAKTNIARNQLYYTEKGFTTASQWMKLNNYMMVFSDPVVKAGNDLFIQQRAYRLKKV